MDIHTYVQMNIHIYVFLQIGSCFLSFTNTYQSSNKRDCLCICWFPSACLCVCVYKCIVAGIAFMYVCMYVHILISKNMWKHSKHNFNLHIYFRIHVNMYVCVYVMDRLSWIANVNTHTYIWHTYTGSWRDLLGSTLAFALVIIFAFSSKLLLLHFVWMYVYFVFIFPYLLSSNSLLCLQFATILCIVVAVTLTHFAVFAVYESSATVYLPQATHSLYSSTLSPAMHQLKFDLPISKALKSRMYASGIPL